MEALLVALERAVTARRRYALAFAAMLGFGAILVVARWTYRAHVVEPREACSSAAREVDRSWGPASKRAVRDAFEATGSSLAPAAYETIDRSLDAYAREWRGAAVEVCKTTLIRHDGALKLRSACLDERRRELEALANVFRRADAEVVENAVDAVHRLPAVRDCTDDRALAARPASFPDSPLETPPAAQTLIPGIAEAWSLTRTGKYEDGLRVANDAVEKARSLRLRSIEARALLVKGELEARLRHHESAKEALSAAVRISDENGDDTTRAAALLTLIESTQKLSGNEEALSVALQAKALIDRLDGVPRERAHLGFELGRVLVVRGSVREALDVLEQAQVDAQRTFGGQHSEVASILAAEGVAFKELERYREADERVRRALAIWEESRGPEHPNLVLALNQLGGILNAEGKYGEALAVQERALAIEAKSMGPDRIEPIATGSNTARVLANLGRAEEGLGRAARALTLATRVRGPGALQTADTHEAMGAVLGALGRGPEALTHYKAALSIYERESGMNSLAAAYERIQLGMGLVQLRRLPEAHAMYRRALGALEDGRASPPKRARYLALLGSALNDCGAYEEALAVCEQALAWHQTSFGSESHPVVKDLQCIGNAQRGRRATAAAITTFERALRLETREPRPAFELAELRFAYAKALSSTDPERAAALARQARDGFAEAEGAHAKQEHPAVENWLKKLSRTPISRRTRR